MRIWHTQLISVLPREQLVAQWRELASMASSIKKKGTPNHVLVNFILDYDYNHFINYAAAIRAEMTSRGYRTMNSVWEKIVDLKPDWTPIALEEIYKDKMDNDYLKICYYNLYEKYLCGGISSIDWTLISRKIYSKVH